MPWFISGLVVDPVVTKLGIWNTGSAISTVLVKNKKGIPAAFHGNTLQVEVVGLSETGYTWGGVLADLETEFRAGDCRDARGLFCKKQRGGWWKSFHASEGGLGDRQCDCAPGCCMPVTA